MIKLFKITKVLLLLQILLIPAFAIEVTIFHTNDIHGRANSSKESIGYAKFATYIDDARKNNKFILLLDAGDTFHGTLFANLKQGENIVNIMNTMGYDAMAAGNHDFGYGKDQLLALSKKAKFAILSDNVVNKNNKNFLEPYKIVTIDNLKIGIIGISTPETAYKTNPKNVEGLTFLPPLEVTQKYVDILRNKHKVDAVIVLAHLGIDKTSEYRSDILAEKVNGVDIIIDGHSHTTLENGLIVNNVLIAQTGSFSRALGKVTFNVENGIISNKKAILITDFSNIKPNLEIKEYIDKENKEIEKELSVVIAKTNIYWDGKREDVRSRETNLGNLVATSMLYESKANIAITNGGGIRSSINKGNVTRGDIATALPFNNLLTVIEVTGQDILDSLEFGLSNYPDESPNFPQISGMKVKFNSKKPIGSKIISVELDKGGMLKEDSKYTLATNDFIQAGGDGYTMFKDKKIIYQSTNLDLVLENYFKTGRADKISKKPRIIDVAK